MPFIARVSDKGYIFTGKFTAELRRFGTFLQFAKCEVVIYKTPIGGCDVSNECLSFFDKLWRGYVIDTIFFCFWHELVFHEQMKWIFFPCNAGIYTGIV